METWIATLLKTRPAIKCFAYRSRNQILCKLNVAGAIIAQKLENPPASFDYEEIAVQVQRRPLVINKDSFVFYAQDGVCCLKSTSNVMLEAAVLFSDPEAQIQLLVGTVKFDFAQAKALLAEVRELIFRSEICEENPLERPNASCHDLFKNQLRVSAPRLRSARDIVATLRPPPPKYWLERRPDFFKHENAPSPSLLFKKTDFGFHSQCWAETREALSRSERLRTSKIENDGRSASSRKPRSSLQSLEKAVQDIYELSVVFETAQERLEEQVQLLFEFLEAQQLICTVSFTNLLPSALEILEKRCFYLGEGVQKRRIQIKFEPNCGEQLNELIPEQSWDEKDRTERRTARVTLKVDGQTVLDVFDLQKLMGISAERVQQFKLGVWMPVEPVDEVPPVPHRELLPTADGIVVRGTLLHFLQRKHAPEGIRYLVFGRPGNETQANSLKLISDFVDKIQEQIAFCVAGVQTEKKVLETRHLGNKTVVKPEKDIFDFVPLHQGIYIEGIAREENETWFDAVSKLDGMHK